jgi:thioredoxin reductase
VGDFENNWQDVIIVGGGPAGLSAALILGRSRRRVIVCDAGTPRNAAAPWVRGFLSRDGINPWELRRIAEEQLEPYGVELRRILVLGAKCIEGGFAVTLADQTVLRGRKLLLATGVTDVLPEVAGAKEYYGRGLHHCPYCDGWEVRDKALAVYGSGRSGLALSLKLKTWSPEIVLCTNGPSRLPPGGAERLSRNGIRLREQPIARFAGDSERLTHVAFTTGEQLPCDAVFFTTGQKQRSELPRLLGCEFNRKGTVVVSRLQSTRIPGLYVAGDASWDVQLAIVAAAEGVKAGVAINTALAEEAEVR